MSLVLDLDGNLCCYVCGSRLEMSASQRDISNNKKIQSQKLTLADGRVEFFCITCYKTTVQGIKIYKLRQKLQKR